MKYKIANEKDYQDNDITTRFIRAGVKNECTLIDILVSVDSYIKAYEEHSETMIKINTELLRDKLNELKT